MSGLNNSAIARLKYTKAKIPKRLQDSLEEMETITSMYSSFKEYRAVLASHDPPLVPYMYVTNSLVWTGVVSHSSHLDSSVGESIVRT